MAPIAAWLRDDDDDEDDEDDEAGAAVEAAAAAAGGGTAGALEAALLLNMILVVKVVRVEGCIEFAELRLFAPPRVTTSVSVVDSRVIV